MCDAETLTRRQFQCFTRASFARQNIQMCVGWQWVLGIGHAVCVQPYTSLQMNIMKLHTFNNNIILEQLTNYLRLEACAKHYGYKIKNAIFNNRLKKRNHAHSSGGIDKMSKKQKKKNLIKKVIKSDRLKFEGRRRFVRTDNNIASSIHSFAGFVSHYLLLWVENEIRCTHCTLFMHTRKMIQNQYM